MNDFTWTMMLICSVMWLYENAVKGFKESRQEEGYTKLDYVASGFLLVASFLLIFKVVLAFPVLFFKIAFTLPNLI